jgi:hypothetical protein
LPLDDNEETELREAARFRLLVIAVSVTVIAALVGIALVFWLR